MKIKLKQIRKLIQEQLYQKQLLQEQIFGNLAYVYHGSKALPDDMYGYIKNKTFRPASGEGAGAMYGPGVYTIREFKPNANTFDGYYGPYVYKLKVNLAGIVSFDSDVTQEIYGKKLSITEQIELIIDNDLVDQRKAEVLKKFLKNNKNENFNQKEYHMKYSSTVALDNWQELITVVRGISFLGGNDGPVIIFYSLDGIVPVAWAETGKNKKKQDYKWQPFEIGSQSQSYDYEPFKIINDLFDTGAIDFKIKKPADINNPDAVRKILKVIKANEVDENGTFKKFIANNIAEIPLVQRNAILKNLFEFENYNEKHSSIRRDIYLNPACPPDILKNIHNENKNFKIELNSYIATSSKNEWTDHILIAILFHDNDPDISLKAFRNPKFPYPKGFNKEEIQKINDFLSNHKHAVIKIELIKNGHNVDNDIIKKLLFDPNDNVSSAAFLKINKIYDVLKDINDPKVLKQILKFVEMDDDYTSLDKMEVKKYIGNNFDKLPIKQRDILLEKLFKNYDISNLELRFHIYMSPACPPDILKNIHNEDKKIKKDLLNPKHASEISEKLVIELSMDKDPDVKNAALVHPNLPKKIKNLFF